MQRAGVVPYRTDSPTTSGTAATVRTLPCGQLGGHRSPSSSWASPSRSDGETAKADNEEGVMAAATSLDISGHRGCRHRRLAITAEPSVVRPASTHVLNMDGFSANGSGWAAPRTWSETSSFCSTNIHLHRDDSPESNSCRTDRKRRHHRHSQGAEFALARWTGWTRQAHPRMRISAGLPR
ncbi:uncharacterized protein LOC144100957 [Amblyomma americanum]